MELKTFPSSAETLAGPRAIFGVSPACPQPLPAALVFPTAAKEKGPGQVLALERPEAWSAFPGLLGPQDPAYFVILFSLFSFSGQPVPFPGWLTQKENLKMRMGVLPAFKVFHLR